MSTRNLHKFARPPERPLPADRQRKNLSILSLASRAAFQYNRYDLSRRPPGGSPITERGNTMDHQPAQSKTIRTQLLAAMREGEFAGCERLPRESVLAERLGISRTQLRDILASLDMIAQSGHTGAVAFVRVSDGTADEELAQLLHLPVGAPVLRVARLCTADGKPAIYCEDVVDRALVREGYSIRDLKLPIFHFLRRFCGVSPYMDLTDVRPAAADPALAEIFSVPIGTPLLQMDEVDFDIDGRPVFCSKEYFIDGVFKLTVMRKKL